MKERFAASDYRFLAVCAALAGVATWYSFHNFFRAFPEASIDFQVSRGAASSIAREFLAAGGYDLTTYRSASSFTYDDDAKTFLERTAGLERANQILGGRVRLWRWSQRWFRPQQKEEYRVEVTTRGEVAGFEHSLSEDTPRPPTDAAAARSIAEEFLRTRMKRDPGSLDFVEDSAVTLNHRTDRTFTWKERDFSLADSTNRVEVRVSGNEVTAYREYLKIPEQWTRDYRRMRSRNEVAGQADVAAMAVMVVGLVVVIAIRVRRQEIRWRRAAIVGLVGMVLSFCAALNQMPLQEFEYPTTDSYTSFMVRQLLNALLSALAAGGFLFVLTAGAEPLYREAYRGQVSLGNLFTLRGLRTKRFLLGSVLGITLTAIFIAYQTGFYIAAYRYGAWSPADVPYSDLLNTRFPWAYVLFGGFFPAVSEEFLFRMFGVPFFRKLARSTLAALVLAGFIWGFGHSSYPQQPFYIRGVEVGIGGVALGIVMLRWGILPTLVWHYSVDAMYSAMLLLRSQSAYLRISGAVSAGIIVVPVAAALIAYWRKGGFEPVAGLLNGDESPSLEPPPQTVPAIPPRTATWQGLGSKARMAGAAIFVAGLLIFRIPTASIGSHPQYRIAADQARAAADTFLRTRGMDPSAFRHVTYASSRWDNDDGLAGQYFLQSLPVSSTSRLFERDRPVQYWVTRYFKPLDAEQILVAVHPESSKVLGFSHELPEDRPGADLPRDAARDIAVAFASSLGADTGGMELKEATSEKQKARRDYEFEWSAKPGDARNVGEATYRVEVEVDGDRPVSFRSHWKVPEAFERAREQRNFYSILTLVLYLAALASCVVWCVYLVVWQVRSGHLPWKPVLQIASAGGVLTGVGAALSVGLALKNYPTETPFEIFQTSLYLSVAVSVIMAALLFGGAAALILGAFPGCLDAFRNQARRLLGLDAAIALIAAVGLGLMVQKAGALLRNAFPAQALFDIDSPSLLTVKAPAVVALAGSLRPILLGGAILAALGVFLSRRSAVWRIVLVLAAACALLPLDIHTAGELVLEYGIGLLTAAAAAAFCFFFARGNFLAYALVLWAFALRAPIADLLSTGNASLQAQGWAIVVVFVIGLVWILLPSLGRETPAA